MKYLILFIFTLNAQATMKRYLVPCEDGQGVCNVGASFTPPKTLCQVPDDQDGSLYKVEVHKDELTKLEKALEFVGIKSQKVKDWDGSSLKKGEFIKCSIDAEKIAAKEAAREVKEAEEKTKRDKVKSDWGAVCGNPKVGFETVVCADAKARGLW